MISKPLGLAVAAGVALVAAGAGVGSYVALRSTQATDPAVTPPAVSAPVATNTAAPVTETEAIVTPPASTPSAEPVEVERRQPTVPEPVAQRPKPARTSSDTPKRPTRPAPARTETPEPTVSPRQEPVTHSTASTTAPNVPILPGAPVAAPEPPPPVARWEELVIPSDAVIGLSIENTLSTERARIEDKVDARVTRDVRVGNEVAIPAGSRVRGSVTLVEQGGKFKEQARLGVRFHTVVLGDGSTVPIQTETIYRDGEKMGGKTAGKIGGMAAGGALIGAIFGGGKGAAIGGAAGAGVGTAATAAGPRSQATLPAGSTVTVRLSGPATVTVEKN